MGIVLGQREKIEKTGLQKYFDEIIISGEVGFTKPTKEIFEIAYKKLNVKPEECIMIGDKLDVDVKAALNAGMEAIWFDVKNEKLNYEYKVTNLREVIKICK